MTFADDNPAIATAVELIHRYSEILRKAMQDPDCEGCAILEGLIEIRNFAQTAIRVYYDEDIYFSA